MRSEEGEVSLNVRARELLARYHLVVTRRQTAQSDAEAVSLRQLQPQAPLRESTQNKQPARACSQ
jgi:hypothetical protein